MPKKTSAESSAYNDEILGQITKLEKLHRDTLQKSLFFEKKLREIDQSQSWRITQPLRESSKTLNNIKRKAKKKPVIDDEYNAATIRKTVKTSSNPEINLVKQLYKELSVSIEKATDQKNPSYNGMSGQLTEVKKILKNIEENIDNVQSKKLKYRRKEASKKKKKSSDIDPLKVLNNSKPHNEDSLKKEYRKSNVSKEKDTFVLYRIIGNDLYPRHKKGQSRKNLEFILENEPELADCEKRFVINRIIDPEEESKMIALLKKHKKKYTRIPFIQNDYQKIGYDIDCMPQDDFLVSDEFENMDNDEKSWLMTAIYRHKNNYIMNNNGARNVALKDGKKRAKWVLPWDGNCFITESAWQEISTSVRSNPHLKYFVTPMARILNNEDLLSSSADKPQPIEEPQIIFRKDAFETFNEDYCYGRRPKVELFWRLSIPGKWDAWPDLEWDLPRPAKSCDARQFGVAGWVARLFSGVKKLEAKDSSVIRNRGLARNEAIISTIQHVDSSLRKPEDYITFDRNILNSEILSYRDDKDKKLQKVVKQLINDAEKALKNKPYSVVDKKTVAPSGNKQDYWHPAPYWWPNPDTKDGLPYVWRDGERVPGTQMSDSESDNYDRTRLQRVFDDSLFLTLAWKFTGNKDYVEHAAKIMQRFFIDQKTRMNPHLKYSQVRMGRNNNQGSGRGIIEFKDIHYYLDAVKMMIEAKALSKPDIKAFKNWLSEYLDWLLNSEQGKTERQSNNNHGTYYDLQIISIATFLEKNKIVFDVLVRIQSRITEQHTPDGTQPNELTRATTQHYSWFNLQGWLKLATISKKWGLNLWDFESNTGASLKKTANWMLNTTDQYWPYEQIEDFDTERYQPLAYMAPPSFTDSKVLKKFPENKYDTRSKFEAHDGVKPYWNLGLNSLSKAQLKASYDNTKYVDSLIDNVKQQTNGMMSVAVYTKYYDYASKVKDGDVYDIGTGQGGSTVSLGLGLKDSKNKKSKVFAIDQFYQHKRGPHPYSLNSEPDFDTCIEKNVGAFKENLKVFKLASRVKVFTSKVEDLEEEVITNSRIGLLALDTDGYINRDFNLFYKKIISGGYIIIDDYSSRINNHGREKLEKSKNMTKLDREKFYDKEIDKLDGGARILGKHYLTYKLVEYYEAIGAIEVLEIVENTLFARKPLKSNGLRFSNKAIKEIKESIKEEFIEGIHLS